MATFAASSRLLTARVSLSATITVRDSRRFARRASNGRTSRASGPVMTEAVVKVGDRIPEANLQHFDADGVLQTVSTSELCAGKKVVLFAVPGAFTPTCSLKHVPGFIKHADEMLNDRGVDVIGCVSVNDAFVMNELDLNEKGLGVRSRRYSLIAEDGVVTHLNMEEGGELNLSGAESLLKVL